MKVITDFVLVNDIFLQLNTILCLSIFLFSISGLVLIFLLQNLVAFHILLVLFCCMGIVYLLKRDQVDKERKKSFSQLLLLTFASNASVCPQIGWNF
jgi:hypothetical protein